MRLQKVEDVVNPQNLEEYTSYLGIDCHQHLHHFTQRLVELDSTPHLPSLNRTRWHFLCRGRLTYAYIQKKLLDTILFCPKV